MTQHRLQILSCFKNPTTYRGFEINVRVSVGLEEESCGKIGETL